MTPKATTVAHNVTVIRHNLSSLENATLALLQASAPLTLAEIEAQLYMQEFSFTQGGLALAVLRLQELGLVGNTLAYYPRSDNEGESR